MDLVPCPRRRRRKRDCDVHDFDLNPKKKKERSQKQADLQLASGRRTTGTTIDHLCDSLLTDIFLRLPLSSAKRCVFVCKRWYALMSNPYFIGRFDNQQRQSKRNFSFIFHYHPSQYERKIFFTSNKPDFKSDGFSLKFLPCWGQPFRLRSLLDVEFIPCGRSLLTSLPDIECEGSSPAVMASCKDLLLCRSPKRTLLDEIVYYICNPLTLHWAELPPAPRINKPIYAVGLMCDCNYDSSSAAAAAASTCKYAVLCIYLINNSSDLRVEVFSSDTGEWREHIVSCAPIEFATSSMRQNGIPYNGLLFWLSPGRGLIGLDPYHGGKFRRFINVPTEFGPSYKFFPFVNEGFGVCNGRLRLFQISKDHPVLGFPFIRVWDLKGYEEKEGEWILEKQVYFRGMVSKDSAWLTEAANNPNFLPEVLGCEPDDSDVLHIITEHKDVSKIVICNMHMQTLEELCDIPSKISFHLENVITYKLSWWPTPITTPSTGRHIVLNQKY